MEEKIQWYQEVLQLEPNSKLFFPLALLLSQAKRIPEALQVLQNGLARHDEYLEARLFYIELLYKTGQSAEIAPELQKLQDLFSHYTGFWQAWAAFIASNGNSMDTSALMRFLSLYFTHKDLSLHTVIDKGLQALMQEENLETVQPPQSSAAAEPQSAQLQPSEAPVPRNEPLTDVVSATPTEERALEDTREPEPGLTTPTATEPPLASAAEQEAEIASPKASEESPSDQPLPATDVQTIQTLSEALSEPEAAEAAKAPEEVFPPESQTDFPSQVETLSSTELAQDPVYADAELGEAGLVERTEAKAPSPMPETADAVAEKLDSDALPDEPISLRTRSMAEVLAEQGDIKGALDIYYELEGSAASVEESADLRQRITTLRGLLTPSKEPASPESKPDKSRVINLIEALSERLEARAQQ
ncbi:MAG: hypothetical protein K6G15_04335 [Desulfovibrio sp.]|nr:hypothetical protein [Desulfovibrio sp.]